MLIHASCIALNDVAILLGGPSGAGKSDLALRLVDAGAALISDDQTLLTRNGERIIAAAPDVLRGLIEVRYAGLVRMPFIASAPVGWYVELEAKPDNLERLPERDEILLLDVPVRRLRLPSFEASTVAKIRAVVKYGTLKD